MLLQTVEEGSSATGSTDCLPCTSKLAFLLLSEECCIMPVVLGMLYGCILQLKADCPDIS